MATEPRRPRFTNTTTLGDLSRISTWLVILGFLASFIWWPVMLAEWLVFLPAFFVIVHLLHVAITWRDAQWVSEHAPIDTVTFDVRRLRSLMAGDAGYVRELSVKLSNNHTLTLPWVLFASLGPSELVAYETRIVGGTREFRNVGCYPNHP